MEPQGGFIGLRGVSRGFHWDSVGYMALGHFRGIPWGSKMRFNGFNDVLGRLREFREISRGLMWIKFRCRGSLGYFRGFSGVFGSHNSSI